MKLNIITILFLTLLLSSGLVTKSSAQDWRWRRHCYPGCSADTSFERCHGYWGGRWGYAPRRFYRRMMWCGADTSMCHRRGCEPYSWGKWEGRWKEMDADFEKYHKEMEANCKKHMEEMNKEEKEWHEHWKGDWDGDYGWHHRWRHHWYDNYYYRGGGY